jgi:hypothetical protein
MTLAPLACTLSRKRRGSPKDKKIIAGARSSNKIEKFRPARQRPGDEANTDAFVARGCKLALDPSLVAKPPPMMHGPPRDRRRKRAATDTAHRCHVDRMCDAKALSESVLIDMTLFLIVD